MYNYTNLAKEIETNKFLGDFVGLLLDGLNPQLGFTLKISNLFRRDKIITSIDPIRVKNLNNRATFVYGYVELGKFLTSWIYNNGKIGESELTTFKKNRLKYNTINRIMGEAVGEVFKRISFIQNSGCNKYKVVESYRGSNIFYYCYSDLDIKQLLPYDQCGFKIVKVEE